MCNLRVFTGITVACKRVMSISNCYWHADRTFRQTQEYQSPHTSCPVQIAACYAYRAFRQTAIQ